MFDCTTNGHTYMFPVRIAETCDPSELKLEETCPHLFGRIISNSIIIYIIYILRRQIR